MPSLFTFLNLLRAYEHLKVGFGLTPIRSTGQDMLGGGTMLLPDIGRLGRKANHILCSNGGNQIV